MQGGGSGSGTRRVAAVLVAVAMALLAAPATPGGASQLRGAVLNDVFQLHTAGTATFLGANALPAPYQNNTLLIFTGQDYLDAPEAITDFTDELTALKAAGADIIRFTIPWPSLETAIMPPGSPPNWQPAA